MYKERQIPAKVLWREPEGRRKDSTDRCRVVVYVVASRGPPDDDDVAARGEKSQPNVKRAIESRTTASCHQDRFFI